jgi:hypothetical protein
MRTTHRTPRRLDDPLRIGPFTLAQWGVLLLATALVWLAARELTFIAWRARLMLGALVVGLAGGLARTGYGGSLLEQPRKAWHTLTAPREYIALPPRQGPLALELVDLAPAEEEPPDA